MIEWLIIHSLLGLGSFILAKSVALWASQDQSFTSIALKIALLLIGTSALVTAAVLATIGAWEWIGAALIPLAAVLYSWKRFARLARHDKPA